VARGRILEFIEGSVGYAFVSDNEMTHRKTFGTSLGGHLLRSLALPAFALISTASIWGQTPMKMPTPAPGALSTAPAPTPTSEMAVMDDAKMGGRGLVLPGIMVGTAKRWMIGYQLMFDKMDGNRIGTRNVGNATVLSRYMASPTDMTMQMHMGMAMYAPTDKFTLMVMVPFTVRSMNHVMGDGSRFNERTVGLGDIAVRGLYILHSDKDLRHRFLLNAGVGLPTGSIDQKMNGMRLEYPMQLGSGTFSVSPGFTYLGQASPWGWGAEFIPTFQIGTNKNDYRLGNRYQPSAWIARNVTNWMSLSARLNGDISQEINGADPVLDTMDEPTKDPGLQGGRRLDLVFGPTFHPAAIRGQEFFVHFDKPLYQSLDGPQLKRKWTLLLGWQYEF
jgi:hypothetical protein